MTGLPSSALLAILVILAILAVPGPRGACVGRAADAQIPSLLPYGEASRGLDEAARHLDQDRLANGVELAIEACHVHPESLASLDNRRYVPIFRLRDRLILQAGPEAVKQYRLAADAMATHLLRSDHLDPDRLRTVYERYFLTSVGDEAALLLAGFEVDDGRFGRAACILDRRLADYPDLDRRDEARLRLAFAWSRSDDRRTAAEVVRKALRQAGGNPAHGVLTAYLKRKAKELERQAEAEAARMASLEKRWRQPTEWQAVPFGPERHLISPRVKNPKKRRTQPGDVVELARQARRERWLPRHELLRHGSTVVYRDYDRIVALDERGKRKWTHEDVVAPRPIATMMGQTLLYRKPGLPQWYEARYYFDNNLAHRVKLVDGMVVSMEGQSGLGTLATTNYYRFSRHKALFSTALVFLDADSGKLVRRLGKSELPAKNRSRPDGDNVFAQVQFSGLPLKGEDLVYIPITRRKDLIVHAVRRRDIADPEIDKIEPAWSRLLTSTKYVTDGTGQKLAMDLADGVLYVSTGHSLVAAMDAASGRCLWAFEYEPMRSDVPKSVIASECERYRPVGWTRHHCFATGRHLIVAPPDTRRLLVFDRWRGKLVRDDLAPPYDGPYAQRRLVYRVGNDGLVLVAGKRMLGIDSHELKVAWEREIGWMGRPCRVGRLLLVPTHDGTGSAIRIVGPGDRGCNVHRVQLPEGQRLMALDAGSDRLFGWGLTRLLELRPAEPVRSLMEAGDHR